MRSMPASPSRSSAGSCGSGRLGGRRLLGALFAIAACNPPAVAGPEGPFSAEARPRNPDHFVLGNGFMIPTPYADVRSLAVATGAAGMMGYEFQDWVRPRGQLRVEPAGGSTRYRLELSGLVPDGFYTAWLVRIRGSARGPKADLALGPGYEGPARSAPGTNALLAGPDGRVSQDIELAPTYTDAASTTYFSIDFWDEIHVAFHADNRAYAFSPGPNHWTQVILPIHPGDGSGHVNLAPVVPPAWTLGSGTDPPTTFAAIQAMAVMAGIDGAAPYDEARWQAASGQVTVNLNDFATEKHTNVLLTADGLVPRGPYSAWLVADGGATCPLGETYDGRASTTRALQSAQLLVDDQGRGVMETELTPLSPCGGGRRFGRLSDWVRIEVVFHADGRLHGPSQGPAHWAQLSVPVPTLE